MLNHASNYRQIGQNRKQLGVRKQRGIFVQQLLFEIRTLNKAGDLNESHLGSKEDRTKTYTLNFIISKTIKTRD